MSSEEEYEVESDGGSSPETAETLLAPASRPGLREALQALERAASSPGKLAATLRGFGEDDALALGLLEEEDAFAPLMAALTRDTHSTPDVLEVLGELAGLLEKHCHTRAAWCERVAAWFASARLDGSIHDMYVASVYTFVASVLVHTGTDAVKVFASADRFVEMLCALLKTQVHRPDKHGHVLRETVRVFTRMTSFDNELTKSVVRRVADFKHVGCLLGALSEGFWVSNMFDDACRSALNVVRSLPCGNADLRFYQRDDYRQIVVSALSSPYVLESNCGRVVRLFEQLDDVGKLFAVMSTEGEDLCHAARHAVDQFMLARGARVAELRDDPRSLMQTACAASARPVTRNQARAALKLLLHKSKEVANDSCFVDVVKTAFDDKASDVDFFASALCAVSCKLSVGALLSVARGEDKDVDAVAFCKEHLTGAYAKLERVYTKSVIDALKDGFRVSEHCSDKTSTRPLQYGHLLSAAEALGATGDAADVLRALVPHAKRLKARLEAIPAPKKAHKRTHHRNTINRVQICIDALESCDQAHVSSFARARGGLVQKAAEPAAPSDPTEFLRERIATVEDCVECQEARGPDSDKRVKFNTHGSSSAKHRDNNSCPVCSKREHAIVWAKEGVQLMTQFNKKRRQVEEDRTAFCNFMMQEFSVEPLGLAHFPQAGLTVDGSKKRKHFQFAFMGFRVTSP